MTGVLTWYGEPLDSLSLPALRDALTFCELELAEARSRYAWAPTGQNMYMFARMRDWQATTAAVRSVYDRRAREWADGMVM